MPKPFKPSKKEPFLVWIHSDPQRVKHARKLPTIPAIAELNETLARNVAEEVIEDMLGNPLKRSADQRARRAITDFKTVIKNRGVRTRFSEILTRLAVEEFQIDLEFKKKHSTPATKNRYAEEIRRLKSRFIEKMRELGFQDPEAVLNIADPLHSLRMIEQINQAIERAAEEQHI